MKKKIIILTIIFIIILTIFIEGKFETTSTNTPAPVPTPSKPVTDIKPEIQNKISIQKMPDTLKNFYYSTQNTSGEKYSGDFNLFGTNNFNNIIGVSTFRGNNYRDSASYGNCTPKEKRLKKIWTNQVGQLDSWTGVGWNGQPTIIRWDKDVLATMNVYDIFKEQENFTEVIYGTLDGNIYFYDLETGMPTRDVITLDSSIKGSVTIDPRGYPLLYVGQGIDTVSGEYVRFGYHIYSLIDGEELFFINGNDKFAYSNWGAFDGNPIIDAQSDTLILPGENGLIYIAKLNTIYDMQNNFISISPTLTKYRFIKTNHGIGTENAIAIYDHYAYFGNNSGTVQCLDLNTLTPMWAYQMEDDIDATIALEEINDTLSLYTACELDRRSGESGDVFVRKLDATNGNMIWEYSLSCMHDANVNGGVLSSPVVGKNKISNLVIFNFSKVTSMRNGKMVALDKSNGNVIWEKDLANYSWSSPTATYDKDGNAYIVFCDSNGVIHLIDGLTGETLNSMQTGGGNFEGSPAIFENSIIIGSRGKRIYRIDIY